MMETVMTRCFDACHAYLIDSRYRRQGGSGDVRDNEPGARRGGNEIGEFSGKGGEDRGGAGDEERLVNMAMV
jgi:hypothetical protein